MACEDYDSLVEILHQFDQGTAPVDAVICPYAADYGTGMGMSVFALFVFGSLGLALTVRTRHPGPLLVVGMLTAGVFGSFLPAGAAHIFGLVLLFGVAVAVLYVYQRAQSSL